jgi:hypothetical protein
MHTLCFHKYTSSNISIPELYVVLFACLQARVDQLRKVHDRMVVEIEKKEKALKQLKQQVTDREIIDKKNAKELKQAEVRAARACVCAVIAWYPQLCGTLPGFTSNSAALS